MKKSRIIIGGFTLIAIMLLVIYSCQKFEKTESSPQNPVSSAQSQFNKTGSSGCKCNPGYVNPACGDCVTKVLMDNQSETKYKIYWRACTNKDPQEMSCNGTIFNDVTSIAKFCYADPDPKLDNDCSLYMELDGLPECIKCITDFPYCVRLKAKCSSSNSKDYEVALDDTDENTPPVIKYTFSIVKEAIQINVCCSKTDKYGVEHQFCCSGDLVKQ